MFFSAFKKKKTATTGKISVLFACTGTSSYVLHSYFIKKLIYAVLLVRAIVV